MFSTCSLRLLVEPGGYEEPENVAPYIHAITGHDSGEGQAGQAVGSDNLDDYGARAGLDVTRSGEDFDGKKIDASNGDNGIADDGENDYRGGGAGEADDTRGGVRSSEGDTRAPAGHHVTELVLVTKYIYTFDAIAKVCMVSLSATYS